MNKISVIQILKVEGLDYKKVIFDNSLFLTSLGLKVEYIVYDNLKSLDTLGFVRKVQNIKYIRKNFETIKQSFLDSGILAEGEKIIYLKSADILTRNNVVELEKNRPTLLKKDLSKIERIKNPNFKYDNFNLLIKEHKSFWEKLKLLFI